MKTKETFITIIKTILCLLFLCTVLLMGLALAVWLISLLPFCHYTFWDMYVRNAKALVTTFAVSVTIRLIYFLITRREYKIWDRIAECLDSIFLLDECGFSMGINFIIAELLFGMLVLGNFDWLIKLINSINF